MKDVIISVALASMILVVSSICALVVNHITNEWKVGAIGVYEGSIQCEQALGEWVCRKIEKGLE